MPRSVENFSKPRSIRRAEREQEEVEYWTTNYLITHYLPQAQGRGRSVVRVGRSLGRRIGCPEGHCDTRSRIMQDRILSIGGRGSVDPSVRDPTNLFPPPRSRMYPTAVFGKVFFPIKEIFREGESGTFLHLGVFIDRVRASTNDLSVVISWGWPRKWRADEM